MTRDHRPLTPAWGGNVVDLDALVRAQEGYLSGLLEIATTVGLRMQYGGPGPDADELVADAWRRLAVEQIHQLVEPRGCYALAGVRASERGAGASGRRRRRSGGRRG